jgi:hypothetical protein
LLPSIEEVQEAERDADDDIEPLEPKSTRTDADDYMPESMDEYISASVLLPRGEDVVRAKVVGQMHGRDGNPLGMRHSNPILDTREYQVEFPDGSTVTYAANVIADNLYMIFDIKFDLTRKARLVLNGAKHDRPKEMTFSSVVSRNGVRIAFTLAALNGLDILAAGVKNAYLSAPTEEWLYVVAGLEFPPDLRGRPATIVRALYGMKSSGARFRDHLAASLRDMGYKSCKADPDVWMKAATKANGSKFNSYVLAYVDDILCLDTNPKQVMDALSKVCKLKDRSVNAPDVYLGAEVKQFKIPESGQSPHPSMWRELSRTSKQSWRMWGWDCRSARQLRYIRGIDQSWIRRQSWMHSNSTITRDWSVFCGGFVNLEEWTS